MHRPLVLIVEDEPSIREHLVTLAREVGYDAIGAGDGEIALSIVQDQAPDLVVTDLHMPRLGGRHLVSVLRRMPGMSELPIMIVTADSRRATKIELLEAGADEFIGKPVDPEEFQARVRSLGRRTDLLDRLDAITVERDRVIRELESRNRELEQLTLGLVASLEKAGNLSDADVGKHIRRVGEYAGMLAEVAGADPDLAAQVRRYAGLHDVGKIGIRDVILKRVGELSAEEIEEMKTHTLIGAELLRAAGMPQVACNIAQHHHERWDGDGYPHGLAGEAIPFEARIVAVVDSFDALVSERGHRRALGFEEARAQLHREAGTHLDPHLVALFFEQEDAIAEIGSRYVDQPVLRDAWA